MDRFNYFKDEEITNLDLEFVAMLDKARHISGIPYVITSGYRTPERNSEVGGVEASAHTKGLAVDLRCYDNRMLGLILKGLYSAGFHRIGIYFVLREGNPYPAHVHVDHDKTKPPDAAWLKVEGT